MLQVPEAVMKKFLYCGVILLLFSACGEKPNQVEKIVEDGVEVVLNRLEPYILKNEPATFSLDEEFAIDFERDDLAELGIAEVIGFDTDSKRNVYCLTESKIFKFDSTGNFLLEFGTKGEGPGELSYPGICWLNESDEFILLDWIKRKFIFFDETGQFLKEIKLPPEIDPVAENGVVLMRNGAYLYHEMIVDRDAEKFAHHLDVLDAGFNRITRLQESLDSVNPFKSARYNLFRTYFKFQVSPDAIYAYSQQNPDYEIRVYDLKGNLVRKIKKAYRKVSIPQAYKNERMANYLESTPYKVHKMQGYFPDYYPPIADFYVDTEGKIFVATYEDGETPEEEMVDIFSADGVFTGRISLLEAQSRLFKNGRLYALSEKESGFQKLDAYKLNWE